MHLYVGWTKIATWTKMGTPPSYLLLMATSPYKVTFSKKNPWKNLLESEKTSNSASLSKVTSIAGLRMFVAFFVFATAPGMWMGMLAVSSDIIYTYSRTGHKSPSRWRVTSQKLKRIFFWKLGNRLNSRWIYGTFLCPDCYYPEKKVIKKKCKLYVEMVKCGYVKKAHQTSKMANQGP